ncbi:hypothetical protein DL93DRAFT_2174695 [Clavulina sp. PMI_390]|nr:hypothetical protein DL93DRAFT_2174695 [Clavulina sp. PMI_390]
MYCASKQFGDACTHGRRAAERAGAAFRSNPSIDSALSFSSALEVYEEALVGRGSEKDKDEEMAILCSLEEWREMFLQLDGTGAAGCDYVKSRTQALGVPR